MEDDIIYNVQNIMYRGRDYALYIEEGTKYNRDNILEMMLPAA